MRKAREMIAGFVAGVAYVASCDHPASLMADGEEADQVFYANTRSGLKATTVQAAIDEIGTTARQATATYKTALLERQGLIKSAFGDEGATTTWSIEVTWYNTETDQLDVVDYGTITFVEGAVAGQGTYTVSDRNLMLDLGHGPSSSDHTQYAEQTGKYFLVGGSLIVAGKLAVDGGASVSGNWPFTIANSGQTMSVVVGQTAHYVMTKQ